MVLDSLIESTTTYYKRPIQYHVYAIPYLLVHISWFLYWSASLGIDDYWEIGCIVSVVIALLQIAIALFCYWFVNVNCVLNCVRVKNERNATFVKVVPRPNNGWTELVPLKRLKLMDGSIRLWFLFQKVTYIFNDDTRRFQALEFDLNRPLKHFQQWKGWQTAEDLEANKLEYGCNRMTMSTPQFFDLFIERATAPFFVFQVFCVGLWCLEDMWYYSAFTLFMLVTFEATIVKQQLRNMSEIRNMGNKAYPINVYRGRKWNRILSDELICGDIVSIGRFSDDQSVPCDLLLLRGSCIVDESMLTGESVPQMKEPIEEIEQMKFFDFTADGRLHVICGGTKIVQHSSPAKIEGGAIKSPDGGCLCYVLRIGFNTSQGQLLRTIMFGVKRVTANNIETFAFILFLLIFAVAASAYLWIKGSEHENRNKYKLFLECSLILTSVIPPELPIELSLAVNNSLIALQRLGIFCTEPFRIPFAGKIDICCFDKTGTLTTDNLIVEGIMVEGSTDEKGGVKIITNVDEVPAAAIQVLAACHSVTKFDEELVGDPMEKACLKWINWNATKQNAMVPNKKSTKIPPLKIFRRYHFSSQLKRMTVIAGSQLPGFMEPKHIVVVKGAPEILKKMYANVPPTYDETYQRLAQEGARILALGIRELGSLSYQDIRDEQRESLEQNLQFAGFLVTSCPLKPDTKMLIKEIVESSHKVTMITGDNPLTACHVSSVLKFVKRNRIVLILDEYDGQLHWRSIDGKTIFDYSLDSLHYSSSHKWREFLMRYEFCATGLGLDRLSALEHDFIRRLLPEIRIFARMSPKQKENVITTLKGMGYRTLMCGDGTNDVGALKHANVGVALLSHPYDASKSTKNAESENEANKSTKADSPKSTEGRRVPHLLPNKIAHSALGRQNNRGPPSMQTRLDQLKKEMEEEEQVKIVRLGDASIAAPFTSKFTSIQSICHVIKQGRCTLVTTLQMFKILALNALVLAYSQSVLYLDGVKFSDYQATIQGLLLAACFLFISRSKPLKVLAKQKPIPNIFNAYTLLTVTLQFAIHFICLVVVVRNAHETEPREDKIDLDSEFKPNLLNSAVYVMSMALQVSTFAVNYRGRPFMESLWENKPMLYSILSSAFAVFALASNMFPDLSAKFELVNLPNEFRNLLVCCVIADMFLCFVLDRILNFLFGDMRS